MSFFLVYFFHEHEDFPTVLVGCLGETLAES